jgi:hypoxanthine phosphoribosyltransferase
MADTLTVDSEVLLSEDEVRRCVDAVADKIAPVVDGHTVAVCLLTGGLWFAADLTRALYRRGKDLPFDALWLASYGDETKSKGKVEVRAGLQRSVAGKKVLILDDVFDTGLSLSEAARMVKEAGATEVLTAVFARKPGIWWVTAWTTPAACAACPASRRWIDSWIERSA